MDVEECLKEWDDLVTDYKRLEVYLLYKKIRKHNIIRRSLRMFDQLFVFRSNYLQKYELFNSRGCNLFAAS